MTTALKPVLTPMNALSSGSGPLGIFSAAFRHNRALTVFGLLMWAVMLPTLLAWGIDDRELRGVSVWAKPLKFMASIGLFALSTAWFIGLLPEDRRRGGSINTVTWTIVLAGGFEIIYITLQAALGQASHFNFSSPLPISEYQPLLAWQIARHARDDLPPVWRNGVVAGLVLTFVLGAGAGGLLGSMQPPTGSGLPGVGWHPSGDLRPAHFLGMHAQQFFPLAGALMALWMPSNGRRALALFAVVYVALWAWAMARGLDGAVLTVPYMPPA
jgi:hypothetical protein